jgi:hypothetical protein
MHICTDLKTVEKFQIKVPKNVINKIVTEMPGIHSLYPTVDKKKNLLVTFLN